MNPTIAPGAPLNPDVIPQQKMITKNEMVPLLIKACPTFEAKWNEFLKEWEGEKEDIPIYICLGDFARHLISKLESGSTENFDIVFKTIETLLTDGDSFVAEATTVGILESLQNSNLHKSTEPENFRMYLLPQSMDMWNKIYAFWDKGEIITNS